MKTDRRELEELFRSIFDDPTLTLSPQTAAKDIPAWDSFTHLNLILAIEKRFQVRFSSGEIVAMSNVGDLFAALTRRGVDLEW